MAKHLVLQITNLLVKSPSRQMQTLRPALSFYINSINYILQNRTFCKDVNIVDHTCKISNYDDYLVNYMPVRRILNNTLMEILGLTKTEIKKIIDDYPYLKKRSRAEILNNYYNLIEAGIQKDTIKNNIWLLAYENNKLDDKLNCIKVLNMDNNQLIPWLCLTQEELANYVLYTLQDKDSYPYNRMEYLSHKLECSVQQLCQVTVLNLFLMKIPVSSLDKKLNILYEYNVNNKDILKDVWVLRYSENHIRHRCELYKNTGKLKIKTWAIRCPLKLISRAIQKNKMERSLMQHCENINEYLQNKLKVDEKTLHSALKKVPGILRVNIEKLDKLIDLLHQNGVPSNKILQHARIFYFNIETIQNRIKLVKEKGLSPNLAMLTQSERIFDQYIEANDVRQKLLQEHGSVKSYLIHKLHVDERLFEKTVAKYPSILRIKLTKLSNLIDMLQQNGITGDDMLNHPKVFHYSIETLRNRIETLKEAGIPLKINVIMRKNSSAV
ncbi:hypothetical protein PUN28_005896 [Cardiocondyla obscurior]